jgi:hypothetical protein
LRYRPRFRICCFSADISTESGGTVTENVGAIVQATDYKPYDASQLPELGYGKSPDVVTNFEPGKLAKEADGAPIKHMAEVLIEDIGSDVIGEKVKGIIEVAYGHGADMIVTPCPMCQMNVEVYQELRKGQLWEEIVAMSAYSLLNPLRRRNTIALLARSSDRAPPRVSPGGAAPVEVVSTPARGAPERAVRAQLAGGSRRRDPG